MGIGNLSGESFRKILQSHRREFHGDAYMYFLFDQILSMVQAKAHNRHIGDQMVFVPAFSARFTQKWMAGHYSKSRYAIRMKLRQMVQLGVIILKTDDTGTTVTIKGLAEQGGGWPLPSHYKHSSSSYSINTNRSYSVNQGFGDVSRGLRIPGTEATTQYLARNEAIRIGGIPECAKNLLAAWK